MMRARTGAGLGLLVGLVVVASLCASGGLAAQGADWEEDLFERLERAADDAEARPGVRDVPLYDESSLRGARINLFVRGDSSRAVYSFRIDDQYRITDLREARRADPTHRVRTTKATLEDVVAATDRTGAIQRGIRTGQIRVERVFLVFGFPVAIGPLDGLVGISGLALTTLTVIKSQMGLFSFVKGLFSSLKGSLQWGVRTTVRAARRLWSNLGKVATLLTILEGLGLLGRLKQRGRELWNTLRARAKQFADRIRRSLPPLLGEGR